MKKISPALPELKENHSQPEDYFGTFFRNPKNNIYGWKPAKAYPPGIEIFQQDTPANNVYFIERGLVKLSCLESGGRSVIICLRRRHWLLGAPAILLEKPYAYTVTTLLPCFLMTISANNFLSLMKSNTEFSRQLLRMLSKEIYNHGTKVIALGITPAKERLKNILYEMILEQEPTALQKEIHLHVPLMHKVQGTLRADGTPRTGNGVIMRLIISPIPIETLEIYNNFTPFNSLTFS